jgi:hypothetical protein
MLSKWIVSAVEFIPKVVWIHQHVIMIHRHGWITAVVSIPAVRMRWHVIMSLTPDVQAMIVFMAAV